MKRLIEADAISGVEVDFSDPARSVLLVGPYRTMVTIQTPYPIASRALARLYNRAIMPFTSFAE